MTFFGSRSPLTILVLACAIGRGAWLYSADAPAKAAPAPPVAATVNGEPIYQFEVDAAVASFLKNRQVNPKDLAETQAEALRQLVRRRLIEQALLREGDFVKEADIDKELNKLKTAAQTQKIPFDQFLAKHGTTLESLRHEIVWRVGWDKYLEHNLTDALEDYFKSHHKDLDGTEAHAAHILLRADRPDETNDQLIARAEAIRQEIAAGTLTFEQAAEKYSAGPSRKRGGDLGLFPRYGVMAEEFARAAFALEKGDVSKPVLTPFGVHLIRLLDYKPGTKQWTEVVPQIRSMAAVDLYEKVSEQEEKKAKIEFSGKTPYYKAGTKELVLPAAAEKK